MKAFPSRVDSFGMLISAGGFADLRPGTPLDNLPVGKVTRVHEPSGLPERSERSGDVNL